MRIFGTGTSCLKITGLCWMANGMFGKTQKAQKAAHIPSSRDMANLHGNTTGFPIFISGQGWLSLKIAVDGLGCSLEIFSAALITTRREQSFIRALPCLEAIPQAFQGLRTTKSAQTPICTPSRCENAAIR